MQADTTSPHTWLVTSTSVAGTSHVALGQPCQDAHHYAVLDSGVLIAAVADGAGSLVHSQIGAKTAVDTLVPAIASLLDSAPTLDNAQITGAFNLTRETVAKAADQMGLQLWELGCTVCLVIAFSDHTLQANIGDSAAIFQGVDDALEVLIEPFKGEYANETAFLSSNEWQSNLIIERSSVKAKAIMLGTDGIMEWCTRGRGGVPSMVLPLFEFGRMNAPTELKQQQLMDFATSPRIRSRVSDDVTILLGCRKPPTGETDSFG
jgi:hypothetical protein